MGDEATTVKDHINAVRHSFDNARQHAVSVLLDYQSRAEAAEKRAAGVEAMHAAPAAARLQALAEGAATERTTIIAWLRLNAEPSSWAAETAHDIEHGAHAWIAAGRPVLPWERPAEQG